MVGSSTIDDCSIKWLAKMQKLGKKSTKDAKTNLALELGDSADFIISTRKKKKVNAARRAPHGGSFGPQIMAKRWAGMWWSQRAGGLTHGKRLKIKASAKMKIITK